MYVCAVEGGGGEGGGESGILFLDEEEGMCGDGLGTIIIVPIL